MSSREIARMGNDVDHFERMMKFALKECMEEGMTPMVAEWDKGKPSYGGFYLESYNNVIPLGVEQEKEAYDRVFDMDIVTLGKIMLNARPISELSEEEKDGLKKAIVDWEESE